MGFFFFQLNCDRIDFETDGKFNINRIFEVLSPNRTLFVRAIANILVSENTTLGPVVWKLVKLKRSIIKMRLKWVSYTFSVTPDWEFNFSVIRDSRYKSNLRPREFEFWLFRERETLFWISHDAWKDQMILRDSVIRKGMIYDLFSFPPVGRGTLLQVSPITAGPL